MKKRILSGILAVMMTMSLLTGCGGNTAPTDVISNGHTLYVNGEALSGTK